MQLVARSLCRGSQLLILATSRVAVLLLFFVAPGYVSGAQIDFRLDVAYTGANPSAGGTWQLFAKSDESGIFSLGVDLLGVDPTVQFLLPQATVNGNDPAGFSVQINNAITGGRRLIAAQQALPSGSTEQGAFYGVGTLQNGSPDFPGKVFGTNSIGPTLQTLTNPVPQTIPWAVTDPTWPTGVSVASGTFSAGATPDFGSSALFPSGSVFTSLGTAGTLGAVTSTVSFTTLVNTNLGFGVSTGDYNGDGTVNAIDFTIWRGTQGQMVPSSTGADGNGDGRIDILDYDVWRNNYGSSAPPQALAVPEPGGFLLGSLLLVTVVAGQKRFPGSVE